MGRAGRILIVEGSDRGFLGHYAHALALGLHEQGRHVRLMTAPCDELAGWPAPFERRTSLRRGLRGWSDLMHQTRAFAPDAVHFQWLADPVGAAFYLRRARRLGVVALYTPHNLLPHRGRWMTMPLPARSRSPVSSRSPRPAGSRPTTCAGAWRCLPTLPCPAFG